MTEQQVDAGKGSYGSLCSFLNGSACECDLQFKGVGVIRCRLLLPFVPDANLRLVGGDRPNEGRLEVLGARDGQAVWGTVCDDEWGLDDAWVVCRQLGYNGVIGWRFNPAFGAGTGPILADNVRCNGGRFSQLQPSYCYGSADKCNDPQPVKEASYYI